MHLLLTNDDGYDAPGLAALIEAARPLGGVTIVAPEGACSSTSHQVTTHRPLRLREVRPGHFSVDAWPVDCARVAIRGLGLTPDWVLSGINAGGNLGADVHISGTVAAVREAVLLGRRGIAFSQFKKRHLDFDWPRTGRWAARVLEQLFARDCPPAAFWNVNFPHLAPDEPEPPVVFCPLDSQALPVSFRREGELFHYDGDYHNRPRDTGADVAVCMGGGISVCLVRFGDVGGS